MKKILSIAMAFSISVSVISASAQNFFKPVPKPDQPTVQQFIQKYGGQVTAIKLSLDSTLTAIRPIISMAAYAYSKDGGLLMSGAGISLQHLKYNYAESKWDMQYGVSAVIWANGSLAPTSPAGAVSAGLNFHFLNYGSIGAAYNFERKQVLPMVGINIPLN